MNKGLRLLILSVFGVAALTSAAAKNEKSNINTLKETITDNAIVYPESFETDTKALMNNWYLKNYTVLDTHIDKPENTEVSDEVYIKRLQALPTSIEMPFNSVVKSYIEMYVNRRRTLVEEMLGMSLYYMPIFEDALEKHGLPLELKYLPVIESAINPNAVSRVGATGLWQFMVSTGKSLGLEINTLVDERRDPYRSTDKAAEYLKNLYNIYHDWSLAIAAYNCGPGNVNKALRRAGAAEGEMKDFWEIYEYLPRETRGYVPAFIAANYVMTYFKNHGISPSLAKKPLLTDRVRINNRVSFKQICDVLQIPIEVLRVLNPQFRRDIIPGDNHVYELCLPINQVASYIMSEDSIMGYTKGVAARRAIVEPGDSRNSISGVEGVDFRYETRQVTKWHKVARNETLSKIARRYGVTTSSIKKANNMRSSSVRRGRSLKIVTTERVKVPIVKEDKPEEMVAQTSSDMDANTSSDGIVVKHTVLEGETLHSIAQANGITVDALKAVNNLTSDEIKAGDVVTIPDEKMAKAALANKTEAASAPATRPAVHASEVHKTEAEKAAEEAKPIQHVVRSGESLGKIARRYGVTIDDIKAHNDIESNVVHKGQLLLIPRKSGEVAESKPAETKSAEVKETVTHKVRKGDTLGKLATQYGVTVDAIREANGISDSDIMVGQDLKIPGASASAKKKATTPKQSTVTYKVRSGDTLGGIAARYGTTVKAIKRASGISSDRLSVGQRLKIPQK